MNGDGQLSSSGQNGQTPAYGAQDNFASPASFPQQQAQPQMSPVQPANIFPSQNENFLAQQTYQQYSDIPVSPQPQQPPQPQVQPQQNFAQPTTYSSSNYSAAPASQDEYLRAQQQTAQAQTRPLNYGDLIADANPAKKHGDLLPFLPNKILFPLVGFVVGMIILAIVITANRAKPTVANDISANDQLLALGTLLAYGQNGISNSDSLRVSSEANLILPSMQNNLSAKFGSIAKPNNGAKISDSLKEKLDKAKSISNLEAVYHDELRDMLKSTAASLDDLSRKSASAEEQNLAEKAAKNFSELYNRINSTTEPTD